MDKRYNKWHIIKSDINDIDSSRLYFKERDIWWIYCGSNVGSEQDGKGDYFLRPVLIFKKFSRNTCWVIPLSTQIKYGSYYFQLLSESNIIRIANLSQMKMIDSKRLIKRIDLISVLEFNFVKERIIAFIR